MVYVVYVIYIYVVTANVLHVCHVRPACLAKATEVYMCLCLFTVPTSIHDCCIVAIYNYTWISGCYACYYIVADSEPYYFRASDYLSKSITYKTYYGEKSHTMAKSLTCIN